MNVENGVVEKKIPVVTLGLLEEDSLELVRRVMVSTNDLSVALAESMHDLEFHIDNNYDDYIGLIRYIQQFRDVIAQSIRP